MVTRLDPEQLDRNERGLAACRAALGEVLARRQQPELDARPMTRSDEILAAAREEAARQRGALDRLARAHRTRQEQKP